MELIILFIVIIIIGALLGGKSLGGTVRKGCGFILLLIIVIAVGGIFFYSQSNSERTSEHQEVILPGENSAYFIVKENCQTYIKPNVESDTSGNLEVGKEYFVEDINKFKYFYELTYKKGKKAFVKKESLERIN